MQPIITGYQYGDDFSYIGPYNFANNFDKDDVHLPPKTTLFPPPKNLAPGKEAAFNEDLQEWVVRDEDLSWMDEDSRARYLDSLASV